MMTSVHDQRTRRPIGGFTWGALFISGLVLLVLHNSAWASAWVTASAILFVLLVVLAALVSVLDRRSEGR
jgi:multisubunit Na+/H+ antiporter MnhB subunit